MDDQLAGLLDDLRGIHPGLDLILDGYQALAADAPNLTADQTKTLLYCLAGAQGGDLVALNGLAVRDLTRRAPAVDTLADTARKQVLEAGERTEFESYWQDRTAIAEAIAALDGREGGDQ